MTMCHLFKCSKCGTELVGPIVEIGKSLPANGSKYRYGSPVGCTASGACVVSKPQVEYAGTGDRIPPAPKLAVPAAPGPKVPQKWVPDGANGYTASALYSHLPVVPQAALIQALGVLFEQHQIPLLGAVFDRFDVYADQQDEAIAAGPKPAEKFLTVPLVLARLDGVMEACGAAAVEWNVSVIDRNLDGNSANLTLPHKITVGGATYRFHPEALNDLVNPRGGHAVLPANYGAAIAKAIALSVADTPGEDVQGPNHAYYFWSAGQNRGINVVLKRDTRQILTVYYRTAVAVWWRGQLAPQLRLDRTV
jgi:hypothetical protein